MKLTQKQQADLKIMALEGARNADIAAALGIPVEDVYAARSSLGYTKSKAAEIDVCACPCCGSPAPADDDHLYIMPDQTVANLCDRCILTVEYVNSFDNKED